MDGVGWWLACGRCCRIEGVGGWGLGVGRGGLLEEVVVEGGLGVVGWMVVRTNFPEALYI